VFRVDQFHHVGNTAAHEDGSAPENWEQSGGEPVPRGGRTLAVREDPPELVGGPLETNARLVGVSIETDRKRHFLP
jgi:hypothetical protein